MRTIGFIVAFLVGLKLLGTISWPWVWVVSPMWGLFLVGWVTLAIGDIMEAKIERDRGDSEGTD